MGFNNFTLLSKKLLTCDVFEFIYEIENNFEIIPGQFITFLLPKTGFGRAYSVFYKEGKKVYFIIKRLENGRGGSKEICDYDVGVVLRGVGPTGHFVESKKDVSKLFIGTGTGIVPLYFMIRNLLENGFSKKITLILGNREEKDLYYTNLFQEFKNKYSNFDFAIFLSREEVVGYNKGYVGDFLTGENIEKFEEYYLCGNPNMVQEMEEKLLSFGVGKENIMREKF